jgi:hypothetical protein
MRQFPCQFIRQRWQDGWISVTLPQLRRRFDDLRCKTPRASNGKRVIIHSADAIAKCLTASLNQHAPHERIGKGRLISGWKLAKLVLNKPSRMVRHTPLKQFERGFERPWGKANKHRNSSGLL